MKSILQLGFSSPVITVERATTVPSYEVHASRLKYRNMAMVCNCSLNIQEPELSCIRILKTLSLATNHSKSGELVSIKIRLGDNLAWISSLTKHPF